MCVCVCMCVYVCVYVCVCVCVCVYVCVCVWDEYGVQAIYITNQVCTFMHMYVYCENSDSEK